MKKVQMRDVERSNELVIEGRADAVHARLERLLHTDREGHCLN